jgi:hypothetical protein
VNPIYSWFHFIGVGAFVGLSFVGLSYKYWVEENESRSTKNTASWILSLIGLSVGLVFIVYHSFLTSTKINIFNGPATRSRNRLRSLVVIVIELIALSCSALAGVVYQKPT